MNFLGHIDLISYQFPPQRRVWPPLCSCDDTWPTLGPNSGSRTLHSLVRRGLGRLLLVPPCPLLHLTSSPRHRVICIFPHFIPWTPLNKRSNRGVQHCKAGLKTALQKCPRSQRSFYSQSICMMQCGRQPDLSSASLLPEPSSPSPPPGGPSPLF